MQKIYRNPLLSVVTNLLAVHRQIRHFLSHFEQLSEFLSEMNVQGCFVIDDFLPV